MWAYITSWLTPTSLFLFLFLNFMIGAIILTSRFSSHIKPQQHPHETQQHLARPPSLLDRVRSVNFSLYKYPEPEPDTKTATDFLQSPESEYATGRVDPPQLERAPSFLERVKSIKFSSFYISDPEPGLAPEPESDPIPYPDTGHVSGSDVEPHVKRSKSEPRVAPEWKVLGKMKKSANEKEEKREEEVEQRRPATTRLEKMVSFGEDGVDAKADDFINRFKQQLKLQRLESLLRYNRNAQGEAESVMKS